MWACEGRVFVNAMPQTGEMPYSVRGFVLGAFAALCRGLQETVQISLLHAKVLRSCGGMSGYVQGFQGKCSDLITMCIGFKELGWHVWLCAQVLKNMCSTFACLVAVCKILRAISDFVAMCKGFQG